METSTCPRTEDIQWGLLLPEADIRAHVDDCGACHARFEAELAAVTCGVIILPDLTVFITKRIVELSGLREIATMFAQAFPGARKITVSLGIIVIEEVN